MNFTFKPELEKEYFYIDCDLSIQSAFFRAREFDQYMLLCGNCYETEEDAEDAAEGFRVRAELARFAYEANEKVKQESGQDPTEWDGIYNHYYIFYDYAEKKIKVTFEWDERYDLVYFPSEDSALQAVIKIGVERLLLYYFGIDLDCEEKR